MSGSAQGHIQGALQGSGNAPSGRVARRISIGVGPRSACGIIIIDIESWERLGGGGGGEGGGRGGGGARIRWPTLLLDLLGQV